MPITWTYKKYKDIIKPNCESITTVRSSPGRTHDPSTVCLRQCHQVGSRANMRLSTMLTLDVLHLLFPNQIPSSFYGISSWVQGLHLLCAVALIIDISNPVSSGLKTCFPERILRNVRGQSLHGLVCSFTKGQERFEFIFLFFSRVKNSHHFLPSS